MKNEINAVIGEYDDPPSRSRRTTPAEDGLLYCGKCRKPKEAYFAPDKAAIFGRDRHPQSATAREPPARNGKPPKSGADTLTPWEELKRRGLYRPHHAGLDFRERQRQEPADRACPPVCGALGRYADRQYRLPVLGGVGTGKSYLAGCIANALMEKEIPVRMTNFALILNDLAASFEGRNNTRSSVPAFVVIRC